MPARELGPDQLALVAGLFGVLAEPTRLALLQALRGESRTVGELVDGLGMKQANVSKQLGVLHDAGLVARTRAGNSVTYAVQEPLIFQLCELVCGKLVRDAERQLRVLQGEG